MAPLATSEIRTIKVCHNHSEKVVGVILHGDGSVEVPENAYDGSPNSAGRQQLRDTLS